jgi:hypothetical protein
LGDKLSKTGDGKDVTITFSVPTEYVAPANGDSLAVIIGKVTKKLGELKAFAFKDTIVKVDLPSDTVYDANYVHTDNNFTTLLKNDYDAAVVNSHTHTNKSVLDGIEGVVTTFPATVGATEGYLPTVGAVRELYNFPDLDWDGDAETVDGFDAAVENTASTIPVRDANSIINVSGVNVGGQDITWSSENGTMQVELLNGVLLRLGQELKYYAKASSTITKGQVIQFAGVEGDHILVKPAVQSEINSNPEFLIGVATQNITSGNFGYITKFGYVEEINTTTLGTSGTVLYYDATGSTAGALTSTKPTGLAVKIELAAVVRASTGGASNGRLLVRIGASSELGGTDKNVQFGTLANNNLIAYNSTTSLWENKTFANLDLLTATTAASTYQPIGTYATLTDGKLSDDVIPSLAISNTSVVADETAMLALTAQTGDVAIRTDVSKTFILSASPATTLANWKEILTPASGVASVSGTAPIVSSGGTTPTISISAATTSAAGSMSAADKTKLNGIATNANNYAHPTGFSNQPTSALTGAAVISQITVNTNGHTTGVSTRNLTAANIGAAATSHTHSISDVTNLQTTLDAKATNVQYTSTLAATSWTGSSAPFTKDVTVSGILSTDVPILDIDFSGILYANVAATQTNWGKVYRAVTSANTITFYASEVPSADIPFIAKVVR